MAQPPKLRSLSAESVTDLESLVTQLSSYLADAGVAFDELLKPNSQKQYEEVTFTTTSGSALTNVRFKNRLPSKPRGVDIGQIRPTSNSASLVLTVGKPIWQYAQSGQIQIDHIGGLAASTQYKATFVVLP